MASANGYGKTVTSGSIFSYDTGDTYNSYIGEPTTNQYTNPNFNNGTTGWTFSSWDNTRYTYSVETIDGPFGTPVNALKIIRTTADTSFADFHQGNNGKYVSGSTYTLSAYVKGSGTLRKLTQAGFTGNTGNITLTSNWQQVDYTVLSTTSTAYPYWAATLISQNIPLYFTLAQSEQKSHVTPFVNGTRSTTQGLLPLISNQTLNLDTVSFDANAMLTFDGTDDNIATNISKNDLGNNCTFAAIINSSGNASTYNMFLGQILPYIGALYGNQIIFSDVIGGNQQTIYSGDGIETGQNHYVVCTRTYNAGTNQTTNRIYIDSILKGEGIFSGAPGDYGDKINIGDGQTSNWYPFYGYVYNVTLYNRTLSESEIQQNYQQYKTRFNLA